MFDVAPVQRVQQRFDICTVRVLARSDNGRGCCFWPREVEDLGRCNRSWVTIAGQQHP